MITSLENRWLALCSGCGLDGRAAGRDLSERYGEPARAYHNLDHVADCLDRLDESDHHADDPVAVEFAIWFHDMVYDTHAHDNEERSAVVAAEFLSATAFGDTVADLVRATRHDQPPATPDAALLCDIDLGILGSDPAMYDSYARAIRREYAWVPQAEFVMARIRVLESFLARPTVYALDLMEKRYGDQARANLTREIGRLRAIPANQ